MNDKKINKEAAVKSILKQLKAGTDKAVILQKLTKTYNNSLKSFYNYYDEANEQYQEFLKVAKPIIQQKEIEALGQIAVSNIMSKLERQILLSEIARGEKQVWKEAVSRDGVVKLDSYDPLKYIAELNKMDGAYIVEDEKIDDKITSITIRRISNES